MIETTQVVKQVEQTTTSHKVTCDLCKKQTEEIDYDNMIQWSGSRYQILETKIMSCVGRNDVDGGGIVEEVSVQLCMDCFLKKLIPWLESQGVVPTKSERCW